MAKPITRSIQANQKSDASRGSSTKIGTALHSDYRSHDYLEMLAHDYELSRNPIFVLQALVIAARRGWEIPEWVRDYFGTVAAARIMDTVLGASDTNANGTVNTIRKTKSEAEQIGKALGFSASGRGSKSLIAEGAKLDRAWRIHSLVREKLRVHPQQSAALDKLSEETGESVSTIWRAYHQIKDFLEQKNVRS